MFATWEKKVRKHFRKKLRIIRDQKENLVIHLRFLIFITFL